MGLPLGHRTPLSKLEKVALFKHIFGKIRRLSENLTSSVRERTFQHSGGIHMHPHCHPLTQSLGAGHTAADGHVLCATLATRCQIWSLAATEIGLLGQWAGA